MAEKRQFLRIAKNLSATFVALFAFAIAPAHADEVSCANLLDPNEGAVTSSTVKRWYYDDGFLLKANQSYTLSTNAGTVYFYNKTTGNNIINATGAVTYTPTTDTLVYLQVYNAGGLDNINVQLEKGSTATSYVPYNPLCATCQGIVKTYESAVGTVAQNGTPTPDAPIEPTFYQQGDMVLRRIGDYADSYDAATGKITRRVGVKVFDGTEQIRISGSAALQPYRFILDASGWGVISNSGVVCSHFRAGGSTTERGTCFLSGSSEFVMQMVTDTTTAGVGQFLAEQYNAGTPVTVYYVLATPVEETPASTTYCADAIKIATTAYSDAQFAPVEAALETAVTTIKDVVANTIVQADAIQNLQDTKQTMPDASGTNGTCPRFRQCLLIETANGTPQWFQIADPVHDLVLSLKNNKVNSSGETTSTAFAANGHDGTNNTTDSRYYNGYPAMRLKTSAQSSSVDTRQISSTLLNGANGGQYKTLGDQEWAVTWDGDETGTQNSFLPGVIYGTSRCVKTSEAPTTDYAAKVNPGTAGWTLVENSDALNDLENIEQYKSCFCKMTGVGLDGMITPVRDSSQAPWVFRHTNGSAGNCAYYCAYGCASLVRDDASFRASVLGFAL